MSHPIFVLEGADCSGKTTLAKKICEAVGAHYMHLTYRWPNMMFEYQLAAVHRAVKISQYKPVVIDRLWMSEQIYAKVFRGGSPWPYMGRCLERILARYSAYYIICIRDKDKHLDHFFKEKEIREEMYDNISDVIDEYILLNSGDIYASYDLDRDGVDLDQSVYFYIQSAYDCKTRSHPFFQSSPKQYYAGLYDDSDEKRLLFISCPLGKYQRANYPYVGYREYGFNEFNMSLDNLKLKESHLLYADVRDREDQMAINSFAYDNPNTSIIRVGQNSLCDWIDIDYIIKSPVTLRGVHDGQKLFQNQIKEILTIESMEVLK